MPRRSARARRRVGEAKKGPGRRGEAGRTWELGGWNDSGRSRRAWLLVVGAERAVTGGERAWDGR